MLQEQRSDYSASDRNSTTEASRSFWAELSLGFANSVPSPLVSHIRTRVQPLPSGTGASLPGQSVSPVLSPCGRNFSRG
jgi:hypothetical protein